MKINIYNINPCKVIFCNEDNDLYDAPYPFDNVGAALAYCEEEIDVRQQAISASIWDANTGELYAFCSFDEDDIPEEDYFPDDVDESNYDPYSGCDVYECESIDFGW